MVGTVAAQPQATTSADLIVENADYRVRGDNGTADAVAVSFELQYRYDRGAVATESTEIDVGLKDSPAHFAASLSKNSFDVDVDPEGGSESFETAVTLLPAQDEANGSEVADYGVVKLFAYAQENGNVESDEDQAQQIVPLRLGRADEASETDSGAEAATASSSGPAPAATGVVGGVLGAIVGALAATRLL